MPRQLPAPLPPRDGADGDRGRDQLRGVFSREEQWCGIGWCGVRLCRLVTSGGKRKTPIIREELSLDSQTVGVSGGRLASRSHRANTVREFTEGDYMISIPILNLSSRLVNSDYC